MSSSDFGSGVVRGDASTIPQVTRNEALLEHMMSGPLTCYDAARLYHVAWLPTLVSQFKRQGHPIARCDPAPGLTAYHYSWDEILPS